MDSPKNQVSTNWRKIRDGWSAWADDMSKNCRQFGDEGRPLHFLHACVTTTIKHPYRTWGLLFYPVVGLHVYWWVA